jgi:biofilm PGA synthesis protein PgaA
MTLADAGRYPEAREAAARWLKRHPRDVDARLALSYVHARQGEPYEALHQADLALAAAPGTPYVLREYIWALQRARMADVALELARRHQDLFDAGQMRGFEADALAQQVRLAAMPTRSEAERFVLADKALARYDELIPVWQQQEDARADALRARIDRLHALHVRVRMADLVREYEALLAEGVTVPRYALNDVASAYLYVRQPERARAATMPSSAWRPRPACTTRWPRANSSTRPAPSPKASNRATPPGCTTRARPPACPTT